MHSQMVRMRRKVGTANLLDDLARDNDVAQLQQILVHNQHVNDNDNDLRNTPLHTAATKGFTDVVTTLIRAGGNVRLQNWKGLTPAHLAATHGKLATLKLLLSYDQSMLDMTDLTGSTMISIAAGKGHVDVVEYLLKERADFTIKNKHGNTAFHTATLGRRLKVLKMLIKHKPDAMDDGNVDGNSPLHIASLKSYGSVIELLLSKGARYMKRNRQNKTPFQVATMEARKVFKKFECYKEIVSKCMSGMAPLLITKRYDDDNTALHIAASFEGNIDIIGDLVQSGANVNAHNCYNETPLFVAVEKGNTRNVKKLILCGGMVEEAEYRRGQTPLHVASMNHDLEILKVLTRRNSVDVNVIDKDGKTPLAYAVVHKSRETVQHLLEHGADAGLKDLHGLNALHLSVLTKNSEITEDILSVTNETIVNEQSTDGKSPLILAVDRRSGNFDSNTIRMIDMLLQKGADPFKENNSGESAFSVANGKGFDITTRIQ